MFFSHSTLPPTARLASPATAAGEHSLRYQGQWARGCRPIAQPHFETRARPLLLHPSHKGTNSRAHTRVWGWGHKNHTTAARATQPSHAPRCSHQLDVAVRTVLHSCGARRECTVGRVAGGGVVVRHAPHGVVSEGGVGPCRRGQQLRDFAGDEPANNGDAHGHQQRDNLRDTSAAAEQLVTAP